MEYTVAPHASRLFSAAVYLGAGILNGAVLFFAWAAVGVNILGWSAGFLAAVGVLLLTAALLPRTEAGQLCGRWVTYIYAAQPILLWGAAAGTTALLLPVGTAGGIAALSAYLLALLTAVTGCVRAQRLTVTHYRVPTKKSLPGGHLRIVQLSDLHLGFVNDARLLARITRRTAALSPDLICITGDTFEGGIRTMRDPAAMAQLLRKLQPRYGVYACLGNHDAGRQFPQMLQFFYDAGVTLLRDESVRSAEGIFLAGRKDATPGGRRDVRRATAAELLQDAADAYAILLDHQPGEEGEARAAGADLLLSGHTHGGQFFPVGLFVTLRFPHMKGIRRRGDFCAVVSTGAGAGSPPLRLGSRGEIVCIDVFTNE